MTTSAFARYANAREHYPWTASTLTSLSLLFIAAIGFGIYLIDIWRTDPKHEWLIAPLGFCFALGFILQPLLPSSQSLHRPGVVARIALAALFVIALDLAPNTTRAENIVWIATVGITAITAWWSSSTLGTFGFLRMRHVRDLKQVPIWLHYTAQAATASAKLFEVLNVGGAQGDRRYLALRDLRTGKTVNRAVWRAPQSSGWVLALDSAMMPVLPPISATTLHSFERLYGHPIP